MNTFLVLTSTSTSNSIMQEYPEYSERLKALPQGIIHATSDIELRPLWFRHGPKSKVSILYCLVTF